MKVLFSGMDWFPDCRDGGLNRYFYEQLRAMSTVGIDGIALVSSFHDGQPTPMQLEQMAPPGASLWRRWRGARQAFRNAVDAGVDLVNVHFALYAGPALRELPESLPVVVHFHGPHAEEILAEGKGLRNICRARIARRLELRVLRRACRVITLSESFARIARDKYGVPVERIRVIPGGIDLARYLSVDRRLARQRLSWPTDRPILICIRRLARRMGIEGLIDAMIEVRSRHPNVLLLIGGKGEIADELAERIRRRQLSEVVRLIGFVPESDLPHAYAAADFAIVPSLGLEGFGLATVEALASGTPVLGTPVGGTPEILTGLHPSLVFDSAEPARIAGRINAVLSSQVRPPDPQQCRTYSMRYNWDHVIGQVKSVFEEAIGL